MSKFNIIVAGCIHGELDLLYDTIDELINTNRISNKIDLVICCGDMQTLRTTDDFHTISVPKKYQKLNTFYKYYYLKKKAKYLTIFISGNHESSLYLYNLYYGGFVAPNMYYLGYSNMIWVNNMIRIGGISGIYNNINYLKGHFELFPYNNSTIKSIYHMRTFEIYKFMLLKYINGYSLCDIFISHDWPQGIYYFGNYKKLIKKKRFFKDEIYKNTLGNPLLTMLLNFLQPSYWFSAHLHVKFPAIVKHQTEDDDQKIEENNDTNDNNDNNDNKNNNMNINNEENDNNNLINEENNDINENNVNINEIITKFLALDKVLPNRDFLQYIEIPIDSLNHPDYNEQFDLNFNQNFNSEEIKTKIFEINNNDNNNDDNNDNNDNNNNNDNNDEEENISTIWYDLEWLTIMRKTHELFPLTSSKYTFNLSLEKNNNDIIITNEDIKETKEIIENNLNIQINGLTFPIPFNFFDTFNEEELNYHKNINLNNHHQIHNINTYGNRQTDLILNMLSLEHKWTRPYQSN